MTAANPLALLVKALAEEKQILQQFVAILEEEQKVLIKGGKDELPPITKTKTQLTEALAALGESRSAAFAAAGVPTDREGLSVWLQKTPAKFREQWTAFIELAATAKNLNDINGRLVAERLSNNQQAIQVLMAAANRPATYGPDGQTNAIGNGRTLGSA